MKMFMVIYVAGHMVGGIGPVQSDPRQCVENARLNEPKIRAAFEAVAGNIRLKDFRIVCEAK